MSVNHDPSQILEHLRTVGNEVSMPVAAHTVRELFELQGFNADAFGVDPDATPPRGIAWTSPACKHFAGVLRRGAQRARQGGR